MRAVRRVRAPAIENRGAEAPRLLHLILTGEQRRVSEHAVEQEPLVRLGRLPEKRAPIQEIHVDAANAQRLTRDLRAEPQRDALLRLNAEHEEVGIDGIRRQLACRQRDAAVERRMRHASELDQYLGDALHQALACPQIERCSCPTPVVDVHLHRNVRLTQ